MAVEGFLTRREACWGPGPVHAVCTSIPDSVGWTTSPDIKSGNDLLPKSPTVRAFWRTLCACVSVTYMPQWNRFCFDTILVHDVILRLFYNNSQCKQTSLGFSNYYLWFLDIAVLRYWRIPRFFQGHRMLTSVPASLSTAAARPGLLGTERCAVWHDTLWELVKAVPSPWACLHPDVVRWLNMVKVFWCSFFSSHVRVQSAWLWIWLDWRTTQFFFT